MSCQSRERSSQTSCSCTCCSRHLPLHSTRCATRRCAVRVAPRPERGRVARCEKCGESAAKVHDQSTGTTTPLEPHGNVRCRARGCTRAHERVPRRLQQPAAPSCQTPPSAAARAPPAASSCRLAGGSPCRAGGLRWRTTRVAARPPRGALLPQGRHEPRSLQPTPQPSSAAAPRWLGCSLGRRRGGELWPVCQCARRQAVAGQQAAAHSSRHGGGGAACSRQGGCGACARVGRRGAMKRQLRSALSCFYSRARPCTRASSWC